MVEIFTVGRAGSYSLEAHRPIGLPRNESRLKQCLSKSAWIRKKFGQKILVIFAIFVGCFVVAVVGGMVVVLTRKKVDTVESHRTFSSESKNNYLEKLFC